MLTGAARKTKTGPHQAHGGNQVHAQKHHACPFGAKIAAQTGCVVKQIGRKRKTIGGIGQVLVQKIRGSTLRIEGLGPGSIDVEVVRKRRLAPPGFTARAGGHEIQSQEQKPPQHHQPKPSRPGPGVQAVGQSNYRPTKGIHEGAQFASGALNIDHGRISQGASGGQAQDQGCPEPACFWSHHGGGSLLVSG